MTAAMVEERRATTSRGGWKRRRKKSGGNGLPPWVVSLRQGEAQPQQWVSPTLLEADLPELSLDEVSLLPGTVDRQERSSGLLPSSTQQSLPEPDVSRERRPRVGPPGLSSASPAALSPTLRAVFRTLGTNVASLVDLTRSMEIVTTDFGPGRAALALGPGAGAESPGSRPAPAAFPNFGDEDTGRGAPPGPAGQGVADVVAADGAVRVDLSLGSRSIPDLVRAREARGAVALPPFYVTEAPSDGDLQPTDLRRHHSFHRAHRGLEEASSGVVGLEDQPTDGSWEAGPRRG